MPPQLGAGAAGPNPMNARPDWIRIDMANICEAWTAVTVAIPGRMYLIPIRAAPTPSTRAASTYSRRCRPCATPSRVR